MLEDEGLAAPDVRHGQVRNLLAMLKRLESDPLPRAQVRVSLPSGDTPLTDGTDVQVVRNGVGEVVETRATPPPVQKVDDPSLPRGKEVVVDPGKPLANIMIVLKEFVQPRGGPPSP